MVETYRHKNSTKTHYHVRFPEVSFCGKNIEKDGTKEISDPNKLCLQILPWLSCMKLKGEVNVKTMNSLEVDHSTYSQAKGKDIQLCYKVGYFGLLYFDDYRLIVRKVDVETEGVCIVISEGELETIGN